ncbi:MAG: hypothetical protein P8R42_29785 [Candidatus Binatia bacterium]|nr:hypothetical protein [Candidatus Binatia bacterium]
MAAFLTGIPGVNEDVDTSLRAMMGAVCHTGLGICEAGDAPSGDEEFTDGAFIEAGMFPDVFPYLNTPPPGPPNGEGQT